MKKILFALVVMGMALSACKKDFVEIDNGLIQDYIADNQLTAIEGPDGLYIVIEDSGTGLKPTIADDVTVHYEGFLLDGTKFDSSVDRGQPATFPLSGVIRGWQLGIPYFREGGKGKLLIPSALGYGENPPPNSVIGKNEVLIFDVELIEVLQ